MEATEQSVLWVGPQEKEGGRDRQTEQTEQEVKGVQTESNRMTD